MYFCGTMHEGVGNTPILSEGGGRVNFESKSRDVIYECPLMVFLWMFECLGFTKNIWPWLWDHLSGLVTFIKCRCKFRRALSFTLCSICTIQTLANWGSDSRFVLEVIIKALISKSSRSLILNEWMNEWMNELNIVVLKDLTLNCKWVGLTHFSRF